MDIINDKCQEYTEIAEALKLELKKNLQPRKILFHQHLAEILINNLLGNAIKYNKPSGNVDIILLGGQLSISNTSANGPLDRQKIFKRFYRESTTGEGNGLGLSIVKQICDMAGYLVTYEYANEQHFFKIDFR